LFAQAQASGILSHGDPQQMMEQFFALLWGDLMLSLLLGVISRPKPAEIGKRAERATEAFLKRYGTDVRSLSLQRTRPSNGAAIQR
jgi:hypothetical protein